MVPGRRPQRPVLLRILPPLAVKLTAILLLPGVALAIGSNDQKITITTGKPGTLNASGVLSKGLNGMNQPIAAMGTGTVIGVKVVGNTGYVAILTADHVVASGVTTMSLGAGPGNYDISFPVKASATFKIVDAANNPLKLPEDVSVLQGKIDLTQGNNREYVDEILQNSIPKITAPGANPLFGATLKNQVPFTEIGYGTRARMWPMPFTFLFRTQTARVYSRTIWRPPTWVRSRRLISRLTSCPTTSL